MNSRVALFVAVPVIVAVVLVLTFLRIFSSPALIALLVVLYAVVSLVNRRKFAKQKQHDQKQGQMLVRWQGLIPGARARAWRP